MVKTVAFIAGKKNPAIQNFFICFSIENFIENISLYALSWPKLSFGCYLTFDIIFKALCQRKKIICFSIENFITNISLYALRGPKLSFGCYLTLEIIFNALYQWKTNQKFLGLLDFFYPR